MRQAPISDMRNTVAIPAAMKVAVATIERCDSLLTPHTP
jgi:hypothetical protein